VEFSLLDDATLVSAFYNLGKNLARPLSPGRRSRFYAAWCIANGEPPRKGQQMGLETFTDPSLLYTVQVVDVVKDETGANKPGALIYSAVAKILRIERP
jgi:hypothetical protein